MNPPFGRICRGRKLFVFVSRILPRALCTLSVVLLWALSYIVWASLFDTSWNVARLLECFLWEGVQCCFWKHLLLAHLFQSVSRSTIFTAWSIWVWIQVPLGRNCRENRPWTSQRLHWIPHEPFIKDVRTLSEDYMREIRSWKFTANTWGEDLCTHLRTHQTHRILYCEAGVAQADS